jgi:hypothetical protein
VPKINVVGKAELATAAMDIAFEGQGSLQDSWDRALPAKAQPRARTRALR